jgi:PAS domain S-box-containing protein
MMKQSAQPLLNGSRRRKSPTRASPISRVPRNALEVRRAFHELQVHQIELEQQNRELESTRERLRSLLENYTALYDFAPVGYLTVDSGGRIVEANLTGASLLGYERERLLGRRLTHLVVPASRPVLQEFMGKALGEPGNQVGEVAIQKADGTTFWAGLHGTAAQSPDRTKKCCRLALSDLTGFRRAEESQRRVKELAAANDEANEELRRRQAVEASLRETEKKHCELLAESRTLHVQLRHLTRQALLAREEERRAISRELHDEVAQILAGINVHLAVLSEDKTLDRRGLRRRVARTQRLVSRSIRVVHQYARELRPAVLDDLGLIPALRSYIREMPERKGLRIRLSVSADVETLDSTRRTVLYRVTQEALTNVTRHARAKVVTIRIQRADNTVRLTVHDDGRSFQPERLLASPVNRRLGLLGMRERVEMVGGRFTIDSARGRGTTVQAEIPFTSPDEATQP